MKEKTSNKTTFLLILIVVVMLEMILVAKTLGDFSIDKNVRDSNQTIDVHITVEQKEEHHKNCRPNKKGPYMMPLQTEQNCAYTNCVDVYEPELGCTGVPEEDTTWDFVEENVVNWDNTMDSLLNFIS